MGVEYKRFLIPRDNAWRADTEALARLIEAWRANNYVVTPNSAAHKRMNFRTGSINYAHAEVSGGSLRTKQGWATFDDSKMEVTRGSELILQWPVTNTLACGLRHPLGLSDPVEGTYYDLELHLAEDFVSYGDEGIDPIDTACTCGVELAYDPDYEEDIFYAGRIRRECLECGRAFRPQEQSVPYRDGITGAETLLQGGAVYRFAIVIDCGKCWRTSTSTPSSAPSSTADFLAISSHALGVPLYEVGSFT